MHRLGCLPTSFVVVLGRLSRASSLLFVPLTSRCHVGAQSSVNDVGFGRKWDRDEFTERARERSVYETDLLCA